MCGDVAALPVGIAHCRFYLRDVEQLVDKHEQSIALPLDGLCLVPNLRRIGGLQVVAQSEYHGERRAELVGDVGEEILAQRRKPLQGQVVTFSDALDIEKQGYQPRERDDHDAEDDVACLLCHAFLLQTQLHPIRLPFLPVTLDVQARILNAVHFLHVQYAVLHGGGLLV